MFVFPENDPLKVIGDANAEKKGKSSKVLYDTAEADAWFKRNFPVQYAGKN